MEIVAAGAAFAAGFLLAWALAGHRARAAQVLAEELRQQLVQKGEELQSSIEELKDEREARVRSETLLAEAQKNLEEQKELLELAAQRLSDTFHSLAAEALKSNNQAFLALAQQTLETVLAKGLGEFGRHQQAIAGVVAPLKEALERYGREVQEIEKARREAYGSLNRHLEELSRAQQMLQNETQKLVAALKSPRARGRWGEITLQRVVEMAGMSAYCDFVTQPSAEGDDGRRRPDLIVNLPNGRAIVVDAKTPLEAYLEAVEAEDEELRRASLLRHARAVRSHMLGLSTKEYHGQFRFSVDFVVLFLPGEPFFSAAVEHDPALLEDAVKRRVLLATPTTLVALLKAAAYGWQQHQAVENARSVVEAGRQLYERICTFAEHLAGVRRGLVGALNSFNDAVGSWQSRLVPGARRLKELGVAPSHRELAELEKIEGTPREIEISKEEEAPAPVQETPPCRPAQ